MDKLKEIFVAGFRAGIEYGKKDANLDPYALLMSPDACWDEFLEKNRILVALGNQDMKCLILEEINRAYTYFVKSNDGVKPSKLEVHESYWDHVKSMTYIGAVNNGIKQIEDRLNVTLEKSIDPAVRLRFS